MKIVSVFLFTPFLDDSKALILRRLSELKDLFGDESIKIFEPLYQQVADPEQKSMFSLLHYELNTLISFMYSKSNRHYNAEQSRRLLEIIETIKIMKANFKETSYGFTIDSNYESFLEQYGLSHYISYISSQRATKYVIARYAELDSILIGSAS
ncbi:hypothetical protein P4H61_07490 [Paenibacillus peoriae]|uniref:hypothetical protein n=1 Tax=Paenibacillus peoriae TaxID=59893 RepID=UPI0011102B9D|nr:hypothetical protein [Paenibacillus peoriae]MEC0181342.1 hypothetical protein [Paenibacillus peoriae]